MFSLFQDEKMSCDVGEENSAHNVACIPDSQWHGQQPSAHISLQQMNESLQITERKKERERERERERDG